MLFRISMAHVGSKFKEIVRKNKTIAKYYSYLLILSGKIIVIW